ncbi:hypothetical protein [Alloyangia pacifica]|uniref:Uncharacterized protein n=1 Tax=Alloyangia pacifica TaxID=311180 RepID=A0A1I6PRZ4_9RHOB|nr:hypothetical protein [Alloyangia pacifica]SDG34152.1 hypothetical protein SAMN04488245_102428 [Alloyangia pacifica]SFS42997.1 hypothetical protein SAMN04488050_101729 [Alloyangia pacifica]
MFFRGSRYEAIPEAELTTPDGRVLRYKRRRVIPELRAPLGTETRPGDRPDLVAYRALGDPELFWLLCDANRERRPARLTASPGRIIGVPGPDALGR